MADYQAQCSSNQYITLLLRTSVASQDVAGNTTTLSWSLHVKKSSASTSATWGNCSYGVTINGNAYSDSGQVRVEAGGDTTILSGSTVVPHNADGTKTISLSASISGKIVGSLSASEALATIARASTMAVYGATIGSQVQFVISAANAGFTHSLEYQFGSATGLILDVVPAGTYTWTPPLSLGSQIPNATSGTMTYKLHTFLSGTVIGVQTYTFPYALPSSVVPAISSVAATEATSGLAAQFGGFVQNKSTLKVAINASGSYGSTIRSYSVSFNGRTYSGNNCTTAAPTSSGNLTLTATVTDSRGRTARRAITVSVLPYAPPAITRLSAFRCDADGNTDDNGDYTGISYAYSISSVNSKNTKSAVIQYKRSTGSSWTNLLTNSAYSANTTVYPTTELLSDYQWDIRLTVSDYFGSSEMTVTLPSAEVLMDLLASGDGMGIGKTAEQANMLDIEWPVRVEGIDVHPGFDAVNGSTNQITDCLQINTNASFGAAYMKAGYVGTEDASRLTNCPVSSGAFYANRYVRAINQSNQQKVTVQLIESYPVPGRQWFNTYDTNYKAWIGGWKCIYPQDNGMTPFAYRGNFSGNMSDTNIAAGTYWCNLSNISGGPMSSGYGWLLVYPGGNLQQFVSYNSHIVYSRGYTNRQWYPWHSAFPTSGGTVSGSVYATGDIGFGNNNLAQSDNVLVMKVPVRAQVSNTTLSGLMPIWASNFSTTSSRLIKENITELTEADARKLLDLVPVHFDYKDCVGGEKDQLGLIAEDVLQVIPQVVQVPDGYDESSFDEEKGLFNDLLSIDYSKLVPHLIKMIQVQQQDIDELTAQVANLVEREEE